MTSRNRPAVLARIVSAALAALALSAGPSAAQATDEVVYYHADAIGSVRMVTDATGQVVARYDYLPFGEPWRTEATAPNAVRFAGKALDSETAFEYFGARYYASGNGRFTTVDPVLDAEQALVDPQRWNRYAYVRNNPFRYVDPDGRAIETLWDVFNFGLGFANLVDNLRQGNYGSAALDAGGVVLDAAAAAVPFIPGGVGSAIRSARELERAADLAEAANLAARVSRTPTDRLIQHVTRDDLVGAAREVVTGVQHGGQHLKEVREAARGLRERIKDINQGLSNPRLTRQRRLELERELGIAGRHLDAAEQALRGRYLQHDVP